MEKKIKKMNFVGLYSAVYGQSFSEDMIDGDLPVDAILGVLEKNLSVNQFAAVCTYYGLKEDVPAIRGTKERVRQLAGIAVRRLREDYKGELPAIFKTPAQNEGGDLNTDDIIYLLNELHEEPTFLMEAMLIKELKRKAAVPYACAGNARAYLAQLTESVVRINSKNPIEDLHFSIRTYNTLKRAGVNKVGDILNYPMDEWTNARGFGKNTAKEVDAKMQSLGCSDFGIVQYWASIS